VLSKPMSRKGRRKSRRWGWDTGDFLDSRNNTARKTTIVLAAGAQYLLTPRDVTIAKFVSFDFALLSWSVLSPLRK
jgi:hypothetical protein